MGNGCTNANSHVKPVTENIIIPNRNELIEKIEILEKKLIEVQTKLDKEFPEKKNIPVSTCYEIYNINGKKVEIPYGLSPIEKKEILDFYKKN